MRLLEAFDKLRISRKPSVRWLLSSLYRHGFRATDHSPIIAPTRGSKLDPPMHSQAAGTRVAPGGSSEACGPVRVL